MLAENTEHLKHRSNVVKSLVEVINTVMSETNDQKYFSDILNQVPVEYVNIQKEIVANEASDSIFGINNATQIDKGMETKGSRYNIFVFADNWSSDDNLNTDTLINTLLQALQQSHYITTENVNVKENKSDSTSEEFDKAVKDALNVFKESTVGKEWIAEHNKESTSSKDLEKVELSEDYTTTSSDNALINISTEEIEDNIR